MAEWYEDKSEREPKTLADMFFQSDFFQYGVIIVILGIGVLMMAPFVSLLGAIGIIALMVL